MNLKPLTKDQRKINALLHTLWGVLVDPDTSMDYERRRMAVFDISEITGLDFDELWELQATAPEFF